jgi:hypothetical protein
MPCNVGVYAKRIGKPITSIFEADFALQTKDPHEPAQVRPLRGGLPFALSWGFAYPKVFDLNFWQSTSNEVL